MYEVAIGVIEKNGDFPSDFVGEFGSNINEFSFTVIGSNCSGRIVNRYNIEKADSLFFIAERL